MPKKFLIVGGGIAGNFIAFHLKQAGHEITIIDNGKNQSSVVAAGLINPIVFRRMAKSWRIDELLEYALTFYAEIEKQTTTSIIQPIHIRRLFSSEQEYQLWKQKEVEENYTSYLFPIENTDKVYDVTKNQFGSGRLKLAYHVNAASLLSTFKKNVWEDTDLLEEAFDYSALEASELKYKDNYFDGVIFCEGKDLKNNPLFQDIKVDCTKGELMTIQHNFLPQNESVNRKCFVLPLGNKTFKIGSTYVWLTDDNTPTVKGKEELIEMIKYISDQPFEIINHTAGVRPTTFDRRPFCGEHRSYKNIYCFNGLGAKGYLLAPLLAKELKDHILFGTDLNPEVSLYRNTKS
jgi:glycine oxidase